MDIAIVTLSRLSRGSRARTFYIYIDATFHVTAFVFSKKNSIFDKNYLLFTERGLFIIWMRPEKSGTAQVDVQDICRP